jgi:HemY protein
MIKLILLIVIIFIALFFGHILIDLPGMVVIAFPETVYQMKMSSALIIALVFVFLLWLSIWLFRRSINLLSGSKNWFGSFSQRQQQRAFHRALNAYFTGDYELALKQVEKSFGGDFAGTNYMLAADIEERIHQGKGVDALLTHAQLEEPTRVSAIIKQAQLALVHAEPEKCLDALDQLSIKEQKQTEVVQLRLQALAKLNRWTEVKDVIGDNKKLIGEQYLNWAQQATHGEFADIASKQGANALKEKWSNLSRAAKKDVSNQICYIQLLLDQGLSAEAETVLVEFAKKHMHEAYWGLFKQLNHASPSAAIKFVEHNIKGQPDDARLYSVLAHLAYNSSDYSLAERAITKALELEKNEQDLLLLATILEHDQSFEKANKLYRSLAYRT